MSQTNIIPPIPEIGDYFYWDPKEHRFNFPLAETPQNVEITLKAF
jgi:hypothetical protein